ncbi:DUF72 domain-containing protein [Pedobacter sp. GSP4]|uniref:DUF72 domain-containing protein n=1 Tax=Pedobacter sp. GSP4 TaxID=3453716 RepID=UPI003EEC2D9B
MGKAEKDLIRRSGNNLVAGLVVWLMEKQIKGYYSGTSGLILPVPNKLHYPEEFRGKSRLCYYSSLMDSIEINSSFYKIPMSATVKKWAAEVPEGFRFTFKLFKGITHGAQLGYNADELHRFMDVVSAAGEKRGCLLVQFPPSVRIGQFSQLSRLMSDLRENDLEGKWKIALEFRHPSLYVDEVMERLDEYSLGMVVHDKGMGAGPVQRSDTDFRYLRFHGPGGNYRGSYSEDVLCEYAEYIRDWLSEGKKVYVYFNNTMGNAYGNLQTLRRLVGEMVNVR